MGKERSYTSGEEIANAVTHVVGSHLGAAMLALCFSGAAVMDSARAALSVCAGTILPSLFPFFVLSILLSRLGVPRRIGRRLSPLAGRLFGVSGAGLTALPVGLLGGYPMGAACVELLFLDGTMVFIDTIAA